MASSLHDIKRYPSNILYIGLVTTLNSLVSILYENKHNLKIE